MIVRLSFEVFCLTDILPGGGLHNSLPKQRVTSVKARLRIRDKIGDEKIVLKEYFFDPQFYGKPFYPDYIEQASAGGGRVPNLSVSLF